MQRRHVLRRGELGVQGTVVRLANAFRSITFASEEEHRAFLAERAKPQSSIRRALRFVRYVIGTRTRDRNTLRYLWIEAGFRGPE
jgi:2-phosphoglycerate kinase